MTTIKTKILFITLCAVAATGSLMAQSSITVDASQVYSTFQFTDSQGNKDKSYSGIYSGAYSIGFRHGGELGGLIIRGSVGMRKAGATMVYDDMNYTWDLQYADIKAGVGYMMLGERVQPYFTASPYYSFLLKGNQMINNENFDVLKSGSLKNSDYGVFLTPGVQISVAESISIYAELSYIMGLQNLETADNGQKAYNRAYALTIGASFNLTK